MNNQQAEEELENAYKIFKKKINENIERLEVINHKELLELVLKDNQIRIKGGQERKRIIVTSDPGGTEVDDLIMIRFVLFNLIGPVDIVVILSGGAQSPEKRLQVVNSCFDKNIGMNTWINLNEGAKIYFMEDGSPLGSNVWHLSQPEDEIVEVKEDVGSRPVADLFVNCGPTKANTLDNIIKNLKDSAKIITVGAKSDGTAAKGSNQKSTILSKGQNTKMPEWDTYIRKWTQAHPGSLTNLDVDISRFILFPNPKKNPFNAGDSYNAISEKKTEQEVVDVLKNPTFWEELYGTAGMFIASRPIPKHGARPNYSNSVVSLQFANDLFKIQDANISFNDWKKSIKRNMSDNEFNKRWNEGLDNIKAYRKWYMDLGPNSKWAEEKVGVVTGATIPLMVSALFGGKRIRRLPRRGFRRQTLNRPWIVLPDGECTIDPSTEPDPDYAMNDRCFGTDRASRRNAKFSSGWFDANTRETFKTNVKKLLYFSPAYDVIAVLMGLIKSNIFDNTSDLKANKKMNEIRNLYVTATKHDEDGNVIEVSFGGRARKKKKKTKRRKTRKSKRKSKRKTKKRRGRKSRRRRY